MLNYIEKFIWEAISSPSYSINQVIP